MKIKMLKYTKLVLLSFLLVLSAGKQCLAQQNLCDNLSDITSYLKTIGDDKTKSTFLAILDQSPHNVSAFSSLYIHALNNKLSFTNNDLQSFGNIIAAGQVDNLDLATTINKLIENNIAATGSAGTNLSTLLGYLEKVPPKHLGGFSELLVKAGDNGTTILARISDWDDAVLDAFKADIADADLLAKFADEPELVGSWKVLSDLTGTREWTKTSIPLLEKMSGKSDDFMDKVRQYYSTHQKPSSSGTPPFTHQGTPFDDFGHPNFVPEVPSMSGQGKIKYKPDDIPNQASLNGTTTDMSRANSWANEAYNINGEIRFEGLSNGRCKIKKDNEDWVECVWHHHEDAKTMIPVPVETHNRAFSTGSSHTGGAAILKKYELQDLIGFFNSPIGI